MRFFERFRTALRRYAEGVHDLGAAATPAAIALAEERLGCPLPESFREFLAQWNGSFLFHDDYSLFGVAGARPELDRLTSDGGEVIFGETPSGGLRFDARGRVIFLDAETEARTVFGSEFERWLDALMAREGLIYDREGEFRADAFEGADLAARIERKRAEAAIRADPDSPGWREELARLLEEAGQLEPAAQAYEEAVALDPSAAGAWFALGKLRRSAGDEAAASRAFQSAGEAEREPEESAFALAHAARSARAAGMTPEADAIAARVLAAAPAFVALQRAAAEHLAAEGEHDVALDRLALAEAVAPLDAAVREASAHLRARRALRPLT
ncbi:MAG: tetratricopeptide repeat protein [Myxococcales bacterium]|nr:tetratricopeptide repeat protein [Myxococcales bacterium]